MRKYTGSCIYQQGDTETRTKWWYFPWSHSNTIRMIWEAWQFFKKKTISKYTFWKTKGKWFSLQQDFNKIWDNKKNKKTCLWSIDIFKYCNEKKLISRYSKYSLIPKSFYINKEHLFDVMFLFPFLFISNIFFKKQRRTFLLLYLKKNKRFIYLLYICLFKCKRKKKDRSQ